MVLLICNNPEAVKVQFLNILLLLLLFRQVNKYF